ncbi:TonB-dependent receptor [Metapseudomonas otitidis]|uniref:TonB-dependent receptor n=1 Tax=Metapseudomonas otitidis TaxID=319939 RepID=UPI0013F59F96|nr:TonB-dependent siderophore receptor [Pseudomonas otitidis]
MHHPAHPLALSRLALGLAATLMAPLALAAGASTDLPAIEVEGKGSQDTRTREVSTATRTATPVRYVPQAIDSVRTQDALNYGATRIGQVLSGLPNVSDASDTRFDGLRIRGFDASNDFYLDGLRDDSQYTRDLHNIERIDVLKGPAAVLYGRGSQGGLVNRISKQPQAGLGSSIEAQLGSQDYRSLYADLSADVSDDIALRLNLGEQDANSFRKGIDSSRQLFAPAMSWQLSPDLNWLVQYEYSRHNRTPDRGIPGLNGRPADVGRDTTYGDPQRDYIDDKAQSLRSRLTYDLSPDWQLRQTLGLFMLDSRFDNTYVTRVDAAARTVGRARWQQDLTTRNLFNSVELEGLVMTGDIEHRLLTGVELGSQQRNPKLYTNATGAANAVPALSIFDPDTGRQHTGRMVASSDAQHHIDSRALYLQDQVRLNEHWQVLLGLRYDHFEVDSENRLNGRRERRVDDSFSPRVGVVWTPVPEHAFYASFSKSYAPVGGGLIGITAGAAGNTNTLDPELTRQKEVGVKSDWLDDRLSTTFALYEIELYNRRTSDPNNPGNVLLSGLQRSRGAELTATGRLYGNWVMRGGIGLQDATIVKDNNGFEGKRIGNVAKRNGSLFIGWQPEQGFYGETGVTLVGDRYADNANTVVLPGYGRWDALLGYRVEHWDLRAALTNLTDKTYYSTATSAAQIMPGDPRTLMTTLAYRF